MFTGGELNHPTLALVGSQQPHLAAGGLCRRVPQRRLAASGFWTGLTVLTVLTVLTADGMDTVGDLPMPR